MSNKGMSIFFGYSIQISIRINACSTEKETLFCHTKIENQSVPYDDMNIAIGFCNFVYFFNCKQLLFKKQ